MPTLKQLLSTITVIDIQPSGPLVESTVANEMLASCGQGAAVRRSPGLTVATRCARVCVVEDPSTWKSIHPALPKNQWMMVRVKGDGLELLASHTHLLFQLWTLVSDEWSGTDVASLNNGKIVVPTFPQLRPAYDIFLNQVARTIRGFNKEEHFRTLARLGSYSAEVNGLAFAIPIETGPRGELLHRFYTYCPALDQFVTSRLNKGIYDNDYLQANLNNLKDNAAMAEKYGMVPGIVCFEPRSVPDELLNRYPVLRGARVDHPMRSFRPRFNLSIAHPVVLEHYAEMLENLMHHVPRMDYISVWSNDSGAGFEYTSSLYVGRNGGGYLVREWLAAKDIAAAAGLNLVRYMKTLRDAGRKVNPRFRAIIRFEPFWEEHEHIWKLLDEGVDVEVSSLITKGWDLAYKHPRYEEVPQIFGNALYARFMKQEGIVLSDLEKRGCNAEVYFNPGPLGNHEPVIGTAFPGLIYQKLKEMADVNVTHPAYQGGATQSSFAPYNINQEVMRAFQFDRNMDLSALLQRKAVEWIGPELASDLVRLWETTEDAFTCFPIPMWIYSGWSVWYRLFIRPIVPNIEAIPESDRAYYEDFLLATTHNRERVDFRYDVGFDLCEPDRAWQALGHMDEDLFPRMDRAVAIAKSLVVRASTAQARACARDQYDRTLALLYWYRTQRAVTLWVAAVHTYLTTDDAARKMECREKLKDMVLADIQNTKDLLQLWETSKTNWIIISDVGETTFMYYKNLGELLKRKIEITTGHENDEPYVDPDFQWRVPGFTEAVRK